MVDNIFLLKLGMEIVEKASSAIIKLSTKEGLGIETGPVGAGGDLTKLADDISEKVVKDCINDFVKTDTDTEVLLITEESGIILLTEKKQNGIFLILDPLDGSSNLRPWKTPSPYVSISLALGYISSIKDTKNFEAVEIGIVRDIFNKRTYYAEKNKGAFVTDFGKIHSSPLEGIEKAIIGIGFDVQHDNYEEWITKISKLMQEKKYQRKLGSCILDFMKVACGEYDACISLSNRLKVHDVAAAQLIVKEAGGIFEFFGDRNEKLLQIMVENNDSKLIEKNKFKVITSGNQKIHDKIVRLLDN